MSTDSYAVIGNPVSHSLSPRIHTLFAQLTGQELTYSRLHSSRDEFNKSAEDFFRSGGKGLSVTSPFKTDAFCWVDKTDSLAQECGAVNTIARQNERTNGYNTDGLGLVADLRRLGWLDSATRILILGAGGATSGILSVLLRDGHVVAVANRTESRLSSLRERFPNLSTYSLNEVSGGWDIVINATSAFFHNGILQMDFEITRDARCYDLCYQANGLTGFVVAAQRFGALGVSDGLGMLVFQAAEAFRLWRNVEIDVEAAVEVLKSLRA